MPRLKVPVPGEMPKEYRRVYWANWWAKLTKAELPYPEETGSCVECGVVGTLGSELKHRGVSRPTNLTCDSCLKAGGTGHAIVGIKETPKQSKRGDSTPNSRRRVV